MLAKLKFKKLPIHIGVIPDGNRRFALKYGFSFEEAYWRGYLKVKEFADWCREFGVKYLTFYTLSVENLNRSQNQLATIFKVLEKAFDDFIKDERVFKEKVRVMGLGRIHLLPRRIREIIKKVEELTKDHDRYYIFLLVAYSGRAEIIDAVKKIISSGINADDIDENVFRHFLYLPEWVPDPDLIFRSSGEMRLSNFMLWYSAYAEFYFCPKLWPEVTRDDLIAALEDYERRHRRFGR